ncbi:DUF3344 domain-containing protein [Streptomyces prunicolor]|uniref:DUF3344 domain-containing protein n=1 Tax=Streptomyces prunicolor TaxID=67348 RepID=UPI00225756D5|nr:DUF3344 domain-containing protein [Streptomyces prunicolor]MCX5234292.1 DUF3344 domain-containing protein [Streptomyces prunicolor]
MRNSLGPLLRRASTGALALVTIWAPAASGASAPPTEAARVPFAQRYHALQHGGIVRAANTSISCRANSAACPAVREGQAAVNGDFDMFYVDVDHDPNTYNSSRAEIRLPEGARATYARLYWGGNLRVGEQKPPKDNGRVLVAEPGGEYKAVLADTVVGHRVAGGADAFQASADVTKLVRESGSGLYTVAQINTAMGKSATGAWGGWTLVVAYEKPQEPLRRLELWDGFDAMDSRTGAEIRMRGVRVPAHAGGRAGVVAYDGDRGRTGDSLTLSTGRTNATALGDGANPHDDVLNSTISDPAAAPSERAPAYANTLGYDSDVFDLGKALRPGGDQLAFRLVSQRDAAWFGALFVAVDAQQ